jgi:glucokinase
MPLLYRAVATVRGDSAANGPLPPASDITTWALSRGDPLSREVVDTFCALLGGYAGNIALIFGAVGGLMVGGGVSMHLAGQLARSEFRTRFEDKGRFSAYLQSVGTALITREQPALDGLVHALATALPSLQ